MNGPGQGLPGRADGPRLAVRGLILYEGRLLLVNAYPGEQSDLWTAPGGGVERHSSLPDNLRREITEETGLEVAVGAPCLVNEFHHAETDYHQVDIYFRCTLLSPPAIGGDRALLGTAADPAGVVNRRRLFSRNDLRSVRYKPDSLPHVAWDADGAPRYDPLEPLLR